MLLRVSEASRYLYNENQTILDVDSKPVSKHCLRLIAELLLLKCKTEAFKLFTLDDLAQAANILSKVDDDMAVDMQRAYGKDADRLIVYNVARLQFPSQHQFRYVLPRMKLMYSELSGRMTGGDDLIDEAFRGAFGVSQQEFLDCFFVLSTILAQRVPFRFSKGMLRQIVPAPITGTIETLINNIAVPLSDCANEAANDDSLHDWEFIYKSTLLVDHPIIIDDEGAYMCPDINALAVGLVHGLHSRIFKSFPDATKRQEFGNRFGDVFQWYVGIQLGQYLNNQGDLHEEFDIGTGWKSIDWIMKQGSTCILIECKSGRDKLPGVARPKRVEDFLSKRGGIADGLAKCKKTEDYIRRLSRIGSKAINPPKEFRYVIVSNECPYLREDVYPYVIDGLSDNHRLTMTHFLTLDEIEMISPLLANRTFTEVLRAVEENRSLVLNDIRVVLRKCFGEEFINSRNDMLEREFDKTFKSSDFNMRVFGE